MKDLSRRKTMEFSINLTDETPSIKGGIGWANMSGN
jgi:hypothetical protein